MNALSADAAAALPPPGAAPWPLVLDLDGTLTPTDTLWESVLRLLARRPWWLPMLLIWALQGRAVFKQRVAQHVAWSGQHVPLNSALVDFAKAQAAAGRRLVLATAAHERIAGTVAARLGGFDTVLATADGRNLKGRTKLEAIRAAVGPDFTYAGDSAADLPVWQGARSAVVVGASASVRRRLRAAGVPVEREFAGARAGVGTWVRALRLYQWSKNVLVFVPLLTSMSLGDVHRLLLCALAFLAFGLVASATYLVNDLLDLDSDRQHPRKRHRPLACGAISIPAGMAACALLLAGGALAAACTGWRFAAWLGVYLVLTLSYSTVLKRHMVADVLALACLYTVRILAGAAAIGVGVTSWLLAFSAFIFLSLALIKRCAELLAMQEQGRESAAGRGYIVSDLRMLWPIGGASAMSAVVVFGLFIQADETRHRYAAPDVLWLAGLGVLYWIIRLWLKTSRGEMHDDPIVYALRDRTSLLTIVAIAALFVVAYVWPR